MSNDRPLTGRKRGTWLAILGGLIADGSIILWLIGGPWQWLFGATLGVLLAAIGVLRNHRTRSSHETVHTR